LKTELEAPVSRTRSSDLPSSRFAFIKARPLSNSIGKVATTPGFVTLAVAMVELPPTIDPRIRRKELTTAGWMVFMISDYGRLDGFYDLELSVSVSRFSITNMSRAKKFPVSLAD
jgi:hypothetical protein